MHNAQMVFTPFEPFEEAQLPPGLTLYRDGGVQVFRGTMLLFSADIPFLVLGDQMHPGYNMTGVYDNI